MYVWGEAGMCMCVCVCVCAYVCVCVCVCVSSTSYTDVMKGITWDILCFQNIHNTPRHRDFVQSQSPVTERGGGTL